LLTASGVKRAPGYFLLQLPTNLLPPINGSFMIQKMGVDSLHYYLLQHLKDVP
jgi:hypothetical protein